MSTIQEDHGPHYGIGAIQSPPDERDFPVAELLAAAAPVVLPPSYIVPHRPPVLNQHATPMCVAYSSASIKAYEDRTDVTPPRWFDFDEPAFFRLIGGGPNGAIGRVALDRLLHYGYPTHSGGDAAQHKIKAYYAVPKTPDAIKTAIHALGEVLLMTPWFHSWFHPVMGVLPAPDYSVGGHAIVGDGWSTAGLRLRNSWGKTWGLGGDGIMPWAYVAHSVWEIWKVVDA